MVLNINHQIDQVECSRKNVIALYYESVQTANSRWKGQLDTPHDELVYSADAREMRKRESSVRCHSDAGDGAGWCR